MTVQVTETITTVTVDPGDSTTVIVAESASAGTIEMPVAGPQGPTGPTGAPGGQPVPTVTQISIPSSAWTVAHSFPYSPDVITQDMSGIVIDGDVSYPNSTHVVITWAGMQTGYVELMLGGQDARF
jgi:hypothetical protein